MRICCLSLISLLIFSPFLNAEPTSAEDPDLVPVVKFSVGSMRDQLLDPPPEINRLVIIEFASLERHRGLSIDINGSRDYIFSQNPNVCGIGGCPLIFIDGTKKKITGRFYGDPLYLLKKQVNGMPLIAVYRSEGSSAGYFSTYVYNGEYYTEVSSNYMTGPALQNLWKRMTLSNVYRGQEKSVMP